MKLKARFEDEDVKFGEVVDADMYAIGGRIGVKYIPESGGVITNSYATLAELNEEWEDYEEEDEWPEDGDEYWFIDATGDVYEDTVVQGHHPYRYIDEGRIAIGNVFRTKEEANKAAKWLKLFKRAKDAGLRSTDITIGGNPESRRYTVTVNFELGYDFIAEGDGLDEIDRLFGLELEDE